MSVRKKMSVGKKGVGWKKIVGEIYSLSVDILFCRSEKKVLSVGEKIVGWKKCWLENNICWLEFFLSVDIFFVGWRKQFCR